MRRVALASAGLAWMVLAYASAAGARGSARHPSDADSTRASRYVRMTPAACMEQLSNRNVPFRRVESAPGVLAPIRLDGRLNGVLFRTDFPENKRKEVPWEIVDCRLALALEDLSKLLRVHDVTEVRMFSIYRPPSKRWPEGKVARRHPGALAIDIRVLKKRSGVELDVTRDFNGRIGAETCGPAAVPPSPPSQKARELRSIVCEAADARIFHSILTPNYDRRHFNHFHMELTAGVKWFIIR